MLRIIIGIIVSAIAIGAYADTFAINKADQEKISNEAEDWMDDMPDGLQDRLSDAVSHAMHGFFSEIQYFRNYSDTTQIGKYKVNVKDIYGGESGNIQMRLYFSNLDPKAPLLIYFHGGGWSLGSINTTDNFCRALVSEGNIKVISVEYPLSPENSYPSALISGCEAVEYILNQSKIWSFNLQEVSMGGDGAGGDLVLSIYPKLRRPNLIKKLVLYYPLLAGNLNPELKKKYGRGYGFDSRVWEAFQMSYKGDKREYPKQIPPTLLIGAGRDIIIDKIESFKLGYDGVTYVEFEGALHGFISDGHQKTAFEKAVEITYKFLTNKGSK